MPESNINLSEEALVITDEKAIIVDINIRAEKLFGYVREELIGKSIEILIPDRFREQHSAKRHNYQGSPSERTMGLAGGIYGKHKDGSEFAVEISLGPKQMMNGFFITASIKEIKKKV